jgi:preprotein translocase subunit SecB
MTNNSQPGDAGAPATGAPEDPNAPALALQAVYLKDCSYEAPNGPRVEGNWNPQINLDLHTAVTPISPELREVVLTVTVSAKQNGQTLFLVEVKQAGAFLMRNLPDEDAGRALGSVCPSVLFPYARAAVSQLVSQGGFPQFLLPPVNFDALYARSATDAANSPQPSMARN